MDVQALRYTEDILDEAVRRLRCSVYGSYLLDKYPLRRTSERNYPEANAVLREVGSPAMTDGKDVYVDTTILAKMLGEKYPRLVGADECHTAEDIWTKTKLSEQKDIDVGYGSTAVEEVMDIILHELTHALNEHSKISAAAEARGATPEYMAKLAVACELQANDGVAGRNYARNILQRQKGVTNKRLHPETRGCHTLREFMDKLVLNEEEKQNATSKAAAQNSNNTVKMGKATGEYKKKLEEAKKKQQASKGTKQGDNKDGNAKDEPGYGAPQDYGCELEDSDAKSDDKISKELEKAGLAAIKQLLLEALSDKLRYDPTSDSVFFDETIRRVPRRTYARPSRKMTAGNPIIKKGTVYDRVHEPNKANKLTVLAVDASGSMRSQQGYVATLLDDLLQQAEKVAREHKLEVHYENLLCGLHRRSTSRLVSATSYEWKQTMENYAAYGGNDFDSVLQAINPLLNKQSYDAVCVINLSDGLDYINEPEKWGAATRDYIQSDKLRWVDALVSPNPRYVDEAKNAMNGDHGITREQVVLSVHEQ